MGKDPKLDLGLPTRQRRSLARTLVVLALVGFAFHLFFHREAVVPPDTGSPASAAQVDAVVAPSTRESQKDATPSEKCDISLGEWVPSSSGPSYTNESCPVIENHQNCMKNGRPDTNYLYWLWKPRDCELPRFDAEKFLESMRNKSWAFIGDSISRNHVQSLACLLSQVEQAVEFYHDEDYKSRKWRFPSYNVTLAMIWSPFLLKADIFEDSNGVSKADVQLFLDTLDKKWTSEYQNFDYIVTSGGQWFLKTAIYWENSTVVGCHYCRGHNLTELGFDYAYRKALSSVLNFLATSYKGVVLFRTSSPSHFENGAWFSGGTCMRTHPLREGESTMEDAIQVMYDIELQEFKKIAGAKLINGANIKLLDTTRLSLLRPDGHPGPYRHFQPFAKGLSAKVQNDCLHWCLPGPIDNWNDMIMAKLLNDSDLV